MRHLPLLIVLLAAQGCSRSPMPRLYTLTALAGSQASGAPRTLEVLRPKIAGHLDRDEVVGGVSERRLVIDYEDRWGAPLDEMIARVLSENLSLRLPNSQVFTELGTLSVKAEVSIELDVQRFERREDGDVELLAQVVIARRGTETNVQLQRFVLHAEADGGTGPLVETMTRLLATLADRICEVLVSGSSASLSAHGASQAQIP